MLTGFSDSDLGLAFFEELHQTAALDMRNCILILVMDIHTCSLTSRKKSNLGKFLSD